MKKIAKNKKKKIAKNEKKKLVNNKKQKIAKNEKKKIVIHSEGLRKNFKRQKSNQTKKAFCRQKNQANKNITE